MHLAHRMESHKARPWNQARHKFDRPILSTPHQRRMQHNLHQDHRIGELLAQISGRGNNSAIQSRHITRLTAPPQPRGATTESHGRARLNGGARGAERGCRTPRRASSASFRTHTRAPRMPKPAQSVCTMSASASSRRRLARCASRCHEKAAGGRSRAPPPSRRTSGDAPRPSIEGTPSLSSDSTRPKQTAKVSHPFHRRRHAAPAGRRRRLDRALHRSAAAPR